MSGDVLVFPLAGLFMDMQLSRPLSSALLCPPRSVRLHGIAGNTRDLRCQFAGMCLKTPQTKVQGNKLPENTHFQKANRGRLFYPAAPMSTVSTMAIVSMLIPLESPAAACSLR